MVIDFTFVKVQLFLWCSATLLCLIIDHTKMIYFISDECNTVVWTLLNIIFLLSHVKLGQRLWSKIEQCWNEKLTWPVVQIEKHVIFGLYYALTHFSAINYVILSNGKMYICRQTMNEKTIYFNCFSNKLKFK